MSKRKVFFIHLKEGCEEAYRLAHEHVWPELESIYRRAGIRDLSCFLSGRKLLVYMETVEPLYSEKKEWLAAQEIERKWQDLMSAYKEAGSAEEYEEVYRLPEGS